MTTPIFEPWGTESTTTGISLDATTIVRRGTTGDKETNDVAVGFGLAREFVEPNGIGRHFDDDIIALGLLLHRIGEVAESPLFDFLNLRLVLDCFQGTPRLRNHSPWQGYSWRLL